MLQKVNGTKEAVPVEVKARVSPNTFHKTVNRFNHTHGLSDMPGLGKDASSARSYDINNDDELLLALIQEPHDLLQILHHAYTYGTKSCYYVISSHAALLYVLKINFSVDLLNAYENITDWLYEETLTTFYTKNFEVPKMPDAIKQALKDKRFTHLKMTEHEFQSYVGLWRVINIHQTKSIKFPLPPIARAAPLTVAKWNTIKGGGDTLTKMADFCQERIGIRSDVLIACSRFLLNAGLVFHRCNQMCSAKDPEEYPTLYHICHANNQRFSSKDSLRLLSKILLKLASNETEAEEAEPLELVNLCHSPAVSHTRKSTRVKQGTPNVRMPCVAGITGKTPGKGSSRNNPPAEFVDRCLHCNGTFPSVRFDPKKKDQRATCSICKRKTKHYCWGCRRYLCSEPPLNGKDLQGKKYPKNFSVKVPRVKADDSLERDREGNLIFHTEHGVLTCYHIAHREYWKSNYENKRPLSAISEDTNESSADNNKQRRSS